MKFSKYYILGLIFSNDLNRVLVSNINGKYDGFMIESTNLENDIVQFSKYINKTTNIKIDPKNWELKLTISNIEKKWTIDFYLSLYNKLKDIKPNDSYQLLNTYDLPNNCHPQLKWLIPMAIDPTIYPTKCNQILIK